MIEEGSGHQSWAPITLPGLVGIIWESAGNFRLSPNTNTKWIKTGRGREKSDLLPNLPWKSQAHSSRGNPPVSWAMSNEWIGFSNTCLETPRQSVSPVAQVLRFTELALLNKNHDFESSKIWLVLSNWGVKPPSWLRRLAFCWFLFLSSLLSLFFWNILPQAWQEYFTTE